MSVVWLLTFFQCMEGGGPGMAKERGYQSKEGGLSLGLALGLAKLNLS